MIENDHFAAWFETRTGTLSIRRSDGRAFLGNGRGCANTELGKQSTASPGRVHAVDESAFRDRLGAGRRMTIVSRDPERLLDLRLEVALYDRRPAVTIETHCANVSLRDVLVTSLEPIRVLPSEGGSLRVPDVAACVTNGQMYYDAGRVHAFGAEAPSGSRPSATGARLANDSLSTSDATIASWWNIGLFSGYDREGVVLGYLENTRALGLVLAARTAPDEIAFVAESVFAPSLTLRPGQSVGSHRFMLNAAASPHAALEDYAGAVGAAQGARTRSIVNGWCSWFYTLWDVSEAEVLRNTAFAAQHLRPFGLQYIQIDEGYQRAHGDWEGNERFPHGMRWLAEQIKAYGFKPGLWVSPYVVSEASDLFRRHADWLVRRRDGSLQRIGNWADENSPEALTEDIKRYCLDITNPRAADWLGELFATIARGWGYEMIKIDFMKWSILAAERYQDPTLASAEVYRRGAKIMRAAAGDDCHILECGPGNTTVGLIDSMRIEADINYGYAEAAWKQYFQDPACSVAAAAKRYYFHGRTWINDVDHVCLDLLTVQQAQAAATCVALSGGNVISGDRLVDLDPAKLAILAKITPSCGEAAVPVDLFDADVPTTFVLRVERPFAAWSVVAFFNPDLATALERRFPLSRLGLDASKTYLAFDFWNESFVGRIASDLSVRVEPGSVTLLALHAETGAPQVLSTSRHVAQGAIELEDVRWSGSERRLRGVSIGPAHSAHDVFVYLPGDHPWTWRGRQVRVRDYEGYTLKLVGPNVARVHVRFEDRNRVAWEIDGDDFLG